MLTLNTLFVQVPLQVSNCVPNSAGRFASCKVPLGIDQGPHTVLPKVNGFFWVVDKIALEREPIEHNVPAGMKAVPIHGLVNANDTFDLCG
jgi:hypothetical protein